jgi:hypothetical protein
MSQVPFAASGRAGVDGSALVPEKSAKQSSISVPGPTPKLRSCVTCRSRKVRCDKLSPCSNCRRANIACNFPSADRPPRWARRLERTNTAASSAKATQGPDPNVGQVMERVRNLESLVKELSGQLEQANAAARSTASGSSPGSSPHDRDADQQKDPSSTASTTGVQKQFGRMVIQDGSKSRYVSSGFWSRVNDEVS